MRISSKSRYGLFLMAELARQYQKSVVQVKSFALKQGISHKYLEQVVISLKKRGLIESIRGPRGGYVLVHPPAEINLYEILLAVQGELIPARCGAIRGHGAHCRDVDRCLTMNLWNLLDSSMKDSLTKTSLEAFLQNIPDFWETHCVS